MPAVQVDRFDVKSADAPDETRTPQNTVVQVATVGGHTLGRTTMRPGWSWSENIKPIAGTDSCQASHVGYVISGSLRVRTNDGTERILKTGDFYTIPPGHEAWNDGDEDWVAIEMMSAAEYAKG